MSSVWWASVPGAVLGLLGVLYTQLIVRTNFKEQREWQWASLRQQQDQHEAQLAATVELEREKHRREVVTAALSDALTVAGRVSAAFRDVESALGEAHDRQHTAPGRAPDTTDQVVAVRQRCHDALVDGDAVAGRLLLLGCESSSASVSTFGDLVSGHLDRVRPPLTTDESAAVTAAYADLVRAVRGDGQRVLGTAGQTPESTE